MSNQMLLWAMLILPFLTFFFMGKKYIKRYIPAGLFAVLVSTIIGDVGGTFHFWVRHETAYPLHNLSPWNISLHMVVTMWVLKFTYRRYWVYLIVNAIFDLVYAFFFLNTFLPNKGIYNYVAITSFQVWLINLVTANLIYLFQVWREGGKLRLAAAKPLPKNQDNGEDKK